MKFRIIMPLAAALALIGCGESVPDEPPPLTPIEDTQLQTQPSEVPPGTADETVVEVEPELDAAAPMESALPMADTAPMTDDFGAEEVYSDPAESGPVT